MSMFAFAVVSAMTAVVPLAAVSAGAVGVGVLRFMVVVPAYFLADSTRVVIEGHVAMQPVGGGRVVVVGHVWLRVVALWKRINLFQIKMLCFNFISRSFKKFLM